jgi:serine/threonine-protein kinase
MGIDRVGEYVVKGVIGEGGMGVVYEGLQPVIGKRVAIKLLKKDFAQDPEEARRLLEEARSVNAIGHRGIVDIFSFGTLPDGRQYFVMEYMAGVPLSLHLRENGPLLPQDVLQIVDEVAAALAAAHNAGVIHRDLKPSNIFLVSSPDGSSYVKLLDFGLAKQAEFARGDTPQTRVSRVLGTPEFMAPEQARAEPVGPRTDLYALGVVTYEMLTGVLPFEAPTAFEIVNMHLNVLPRPPSEREPAVPPEVDQLVLKLLEKVPANRPPSAEVVRQEIKRLRKVLKLSATRLVAPVVPLDPAKPKLPPAPHVPGENEFTWTPSSASKKDARDTRPAPVTGRVEPENDEASAPTRRIEPPKPSTPKPRRSAPPPPPAPPEPPPGGFRARLKGQEEPPSVVQGSKTPFLVIGMILLIVAIALGAFFAGRRVAVPAPPPAPAAP